MIHQIYELIIQSHNKGMDDKYQNDGITYQNLLYWKEF